MNAGADRPVARPRGPVGELVHWFEAAKELLHRALVAKNLLAQVPGGVRDHRLDVEVLDRND